MRRQAGLQVATSATRAAVRQAADAVRTAAREQGGLLEIAEVRALLRDAVREQLEAADEAGSGSRSRRRGGDTPGGSLSSRSGSGGQKFTGLDLGPPSVERSSALFVLGGRAGSGSPLGGGFGSRVSSRGADRRGRGGTPGVSSGIELARAVLSTVGSPVEFTPLIG